MKALLSAITVAIFLIPVYGRAQSPVTSADTSLETSLIAGDVASPTTTAAGAGRPKEGCQNDETRARFEEKNWRIVRYARGW